MLHQTIGPYDYRCIWLILLHFCTQDINELTQSIYIPRGVNTEALSRTASWDYQPEGFKVSCVYHEVTKWPFNYHPTYTSFRRRVSYWAFQKKELIKKQQESSSPCAFILRTELRTKGCVFHSRKK